MKKEHRFDRGLRALALPARTVLALALAGLMLLPGAASVAASSPNCTSEQGQDFIDAGQLTQAIHEFTCVIDAEPTEVDGYRGRAEALLLLGRFSDAYHDYNTGITALVVPVHPDAFGTIYDHYAARLAVDPDSIPALTGASFARWVNFDYPQAIQVLNQLLDVAPDDLFGTLFRGSSRLLHGKTTAKGVAELDRAIELAPDSPDVRHIVADAYTYGLPDPVRAAAEANLALDGGLDTARVHAILAASHNAFGELLPAAEHIERHFDLVTTELISDGAPGGRRFGDARSRPGAVVCHPDRGKCWADDLDLDVQPRLLGLDCRPVRTGRGASRRQRRRQRLLRGVRLGSCRDGHVRPVRLVIRERLHGRARRRAILTAHRLVHEGPIRESGSGLLRHRLQLRRLTIYVY